MYMGRSVAHMKRARFWK